MEHVRIGEVDTPEEIAKALNKIIDKLNDNDKYNKSVDEYNDELAEKGNTK